MRFSLPVSALLHGGLIAWALVGLQEVKPFKPPEPEPVEVAMITEDGLTRLRQGDRNSKNLEAAPAKIAPPSQAVKETPKAKPPEPAPPPPPPPPEPAKVEPPPPPPKPEPPKAAEPRKDEIAALALQAEAEAQAKAEAERKAAEERKRQEELKRRQEAEKKRRDELKKKQDEQKRLAELKRKADEAKKKQSEESFEDLMQKALKDNDPRKRAPQPGGPQVAAAPSNVKGPLAGAPEGRDTKLTASEANLLGSLMKKQVARCWNISAGADGVDKIRIEVEVRLSPDGRIQGQPRVVSRGTGPLYADMADSAMRALIQCQAPNGYDLPKHLYKGGWDHMIVEFDPTRMF